jgi:hypothetical protein
MRLGGQYPTSRRRRYNRGTATIEEALGDLHSGDPVRRAKAALRVGRLGVAGTWAIPALIEAVDRQNSVD